MLNTMFPLVESRCALRADHPAEHGIVTDVVVAARAYAGTGLIKAVCPSAGRLAAVPVDGDAEGSRAPRHGKWIFGHFGDILGRGDIARRSCPDEERRSVKPVKWVAGPPGGCGQRTGTRRETSPWKTRQAPPDHSCWHKEVTVKTGALRGCWPRKRFVVRLRARTSRAGKSGLATAARARSNRRCPAGQTRPRARKPARW